MVRLWKKGREETCRTRINLYCYIARMNIKRDWLVCDRVALHKCNVRRPATCEKLLHAPTGYVHQK